MKALFRWLLEKGKGKKHLLSEQTAQAHDGSDPQYRDDVSGDEKERKQNTGEGCSADSSCSQRSGGSPLFMEKFSSGHAGRDRTDQSGAKDSGVMISAAAAAEEEPGQNKRT